MTEDSPHPPAASWPRDETIALVREGMRASVVGRYGSQSEALQLTAKHLSDKVLREFVLERFELMLSVLADQNETVGVGRREQIGDKTKFNRRIENALQVRIPTAPNKSSDLSNSIFRDVAAHLNEGRSIGAAWGHLELDSEGIWMAYERSKLFAKALRGRRAVMTFSNGHI